MSRKAEDLAGRIRSFTDEVIRFTENLSDDDWMKVCDWEEWTVGVTARHIGAGHLAIFDLVGMMVRGEQLPQLTMDQINAMSKKDSRDHADCTKAEALDYLNKNSAKLVAFVSGLSDEDLERKGGMPAFGGEVTVAQFIDFIIFQSTAQHFDSMKSAVAA